MDRGSWHCTGGTDKDHPKKKKWRKAKWLSDEALQIAEKKREAKGKGKQEKIYPFKCRAPKNNKERKESLPQWSMQRNKRKTIEWGRLEISLYVVCLKYYIAYTYVFQKIVRQYSKILTMKNVLCGLWVIFVFFFILMHIFQVLYKKNILML